MASARLHIGYGQPHDRVTHHCAGWARGLQSLRQAQGISGSKSSSANEGSSSVVTVTKAKVKVETSAGGARKKVQRLCESAALRPMARRSAAAGVGELQPNPPSENARRSREFESR